MTCFRLDHDLFPTRISEFTIGKSPLVTWLGLRVERHRLRERGDQARIVVAGEGGGCVSEAREAPHELADGVEHPGLRCHDRLLPDLGLRAMHLGFGVRCLRLEVWELVFGAWSFGC